MQESNISPIKMDNSESDIEAKEKAAEYIYDLLGSLQKIAQIHNMPVLARFLGMAKEEAREQH